MFSLDKPFRCKECGTELPSKERLRKHERFHKEAVWKDAGYVDPNNAQYTTFANPSNNKVAFAVSKLLGKDDDRMKRKRVNQN